MLLESINSPADLVRLDGDELAILAEEIRGFIVRAVSATSGHLGSNLGAVELTLALHRVFNSPAGHSALGYRPPGLRPQDRDRPAGDVRHPAPDRWPVGLSVPGRVGPRLGGKQPRLDDPQLRPRPGRGRGPEQQPRTPGGGGGRRWLHDRRHGLRGAQQPRATAAAAVVVVLNDNGRSYAPTISRLSESLTRIRLHPGLTSVRGRVEEGLRDLPGRREPGLLQPAGPVLGGAGGDRAAGVLRGARRPLCRSDRRA